jgi:hypothetical protein
MTGITRDDVRAAVASGTLSEAQAASLIVLSEERAGVRAHLSGLDEPFELFKGFNEIFIVVGLVILYMGFAGVAGLTLFGTTNGYILGMVYSVIAMGAIVLLARYFTLKRRMVAPSIALSVMFGLSSAQFGMAFSAMLDLTTPQTLTCAAGIAALGLTAYYALFRVPFTVALIALSVYATVFGVTTLGGDVPEGSARHLPAQRRRSLRRDHDVPRPRRADRRHDLRHVRSASRDASRGLGLLAACDRGAGYRQHDRADAVRCRHDPGADHAGRFHRASRRDRRGDRPAVLPRLRRRLCRGARHHSGRGTGVFRHPHPRGGPRPAWCAMGGAAPRDHARLPAFPGKTRLPPYDLMQKETPA